MIESASHNEAENFTNTINSIKNKLVNRFLFYGLIIALFAIFIPTLLNPNNLTIDFYFDLVNLFALASVYFFRTKLSLSFKIGYLILIVYSFFVTNLYQHGLSSVANAILVLVPFLSILVFTAKQTVAIHVFSMVSFFLISIIHIERPFTFENPEFTNDLIEWFIYAMILTLVCLVVAFLVFNLNNSLFRLIKNYESNYLKLQKQDTVLKQNIDDKEVLLQEIHHRVKNNLAVVSGLLELQSNRAPDEFSRTTLKLSTNRILSISKVHELLYQSEDMSRIHLKKYVKELAEIIIESFNKTGKHIELEMDIHVQYLNINHGVPVGIILNELMTNSLKHGFNRKQDEYTIRITAFEEKDHYEISYQDNGTGIEVDKTEKPRGLGQTLIKSLLIQLAAEHHLNTEGKYQMSFRFPKKKTLQ
ncbi:MAG: hypothetical protein JJ895_00685 [Balneolaceae bacterium]|nr:hypothetical protein [Balneolaceae bacterium]